MVAKETIVKRRAYVLRKLTESSAYTSGQDMADALNVSRESIGKYIEYLRANGYEIESKRREGYRLIRGSGNLLPEEIYRYLKPGIVENFVYARAMTSTNDTAIKNNAYHKPILVIAETQSSGRGRRGDAWQSPLGGIWMSLGLRTDIDVRYATWLPLAAAIETTKVIVELSGIGAQVKWPNDILIDGRKVAGILIESVLEADAIIRVVIGVGVNANFSISELSQSISRHAVSLMDITESPVDRPKYAAALSNRIIKAVDSIGRGRIEDYRKSWTSFDALVGKRIKVDAGKKKISGQAGGLDESGRLVVETRTGTETISSGHVEIIGR